MLFQSYEFVFFLGCVITLFYLAPGKLRPVALLAANLVFFCAAAPQTVVWLVITILSTYTCAVRIEKTENKKCRKWIAAGCIFMNLLLLAVFRYFPVWDVLINAMYGKGIRKVHLDIAGDWGLIAPLGISFYTMQAIGYLADVVSGKYHAEKNLLHFSVFISFFPNLSSGPIERAEHFLPQLKKISRMKRRKLLHYDRIMIGFVSILWGLFLKMVIADRAAILVDHLYELYEYTDSFTMLMAALFYSVQIFCDFASYSCIAVGTAQLMGFSLIQNFRQPYLAVGFQEFWNRWHISLSSWLRDYIYIPLGGNRKGVLRRYLNILITFLVSGLWHGGAPQFLVWGTLHGLCQVVEDLVKKGWCLTRGKKNGKDASAAKAKQKPGTTDFCRMISCGLLRFTYGVFTFGVVTVLWIFFRSDSVKMALTCIRNLFTKPQGFQTAGELLFVLGLDKTEFLLAVSGIAVLLLFELVSEWTRKTTAEWIYRSPLPIRYVICLFLIGAVFVFGKYGVGFDASNFIYMGF